MLKKFILGTESKESSFHYVIQFSLSTFRFRLPKSSQDLFFLRRARAISAISLALE